MKRFVRILTTGIVLVRLVGGAGAQVGGLDGALDQQRQDLQRQQSESQREVEAQQRALQRQQDQVLRDQLRSSPRRFPSPGCRPVGTGLVCD